MLLGELLFGNVIRKMAAILYFDNIGKLRLKYCVICDIVVPEKIHVATKINLIFTKVLIL